MLSSAASAPGIGLAERGIAGGRTRPPAPPLRPRRAARRPAAASAGRQPAGPASAATGARLAAIRPTIGRPTSRMAASATRASSALSASRVASAGDSGRPRKPGAPRRRRLLDEAHRDDLDLVAAPLVEADGAADQGGDAGQLLRRAFAPARRLALRARHAIHQHGDRAAHHRVLPQRVAGGPADLVIRRLLLPVLGGAGRRRARLGARQVAGDGGGRRLGAAVLLGRALLAAGDLVSGSKRSSRVSTRSKSISTVGLGADPAGAEAAFQQFLDRPAEAQLLRPADLLLVLRRGRPADGLAAAGQQGAAAVDDGDTLRLEPGHRGGDQCSTACTPSAVQPLAPCMASTMLAWASPRSREKASRRGSTRWTRAARTPARPRMVRASSPSSARSRFTSC